jgi:hypothetical protein
MTRKEREELCKLSEDSFGSKYAWLSYLRTPYYVKENAPMANGKMREVKVAKWRTLDEVKALMAGKDHIVETLNKEVENESKVLPES